MKKLIPIIVVLVLAAAAVAFLALNRPARASSLPPVRPAAPVAQNAPASSSLKVIGNLTSASQATLAFLASGRVQSISVKEGDPVVSGTVLAVLDTTTLNLQVAQAQAALDAANATLQNTEAGPTQDSIQLAKSNLDLAKGTLSQAQAAYDRIGGDSNPFAQLSPQALALQQATSAFRSAQAAYNIAVDHPTSTESQLAVAQATQAQAALNLAKQNIANAKITSPVTGTVLWIGPHLGESVTAGVPAITVADLQHMQVQVGVDENSLPYVTLGQAGTITLDSMPGRTFTGKVSKIGILATTTSGIVSVPVTLDIDPTDALIYPGLSATVELTLNP